MAPSYIIKSHICFSKIKKPTYGCCEINLTVTVCIFNPAKTFGTDLREEYVVMDEIWISGHDLVCVIVSLREKSLSHSGRVLLQGSSFFIAHLVYEINQRSVYPSRVFFMAVYDLLISVS